MQNLFLILPGMTGEYVYGYPMNSQKAPFKLDLSATPWEVLRLDPSDKPLRVHSLLSPKKFPPKDRLFRTAGKSIRFGKGQKILVPAAPASGKTTLMAKIGGLIAESGKANVTNIMIDERPEETLTGRTINLSYMKSDSDIINGLLVTLGEVMFKVLNQKTDEVVIIDSMTRLVQVANSLILKENKDIPSGTGGLTLQSRKFVRQIFGLGNRLQQGSLTIIATCLVGGSNVEDVVYKDLQGVSTAEIFISRDAKGEVIIDPKKSYVRNQQTII